MKLSITHATEYQYTEPLEYAIQSLHLAPQSGPSQIVLDWRIDTQGPVSFWRDGLGNLIHTYSHHRLGLRSEIVASGTVHTQNTSVLEEPNGMHPSYFLREGLYTKRESRMTQWAKGCVGGCPATPESVLGLAKAVAGKVKYKTGKTVVETSALEAFDWGAGVCQDQAHVMAVVCRGLGWPARYVSGYFYDPQAPELASHAWVDVCVSVPHARWVSVDVTHECFTDERHVRIAVGVDYAQCPPVRGVRQGGGHETMNASVSIAEV